MDQYHPFFLTSLLALGVLFLFFFIFSFFTKKNPSGKLPPGNLGWPVIGETLDFSSSGRLKFFMERMNKYSPEMFKTSILGNRMAAICGPSGNKFAFSNEDKIFTSWWPPSMNKLLFTDGSTIPSNSKHDRQKINEMFKPDNLHKYVPYIHSITEQHLDTEWVPNREVKVVPLSTKLTCKLGQQLLIGIKEPKLEAKLAVHFNDLVGGMASVPVNFPGTAFHRAIKAAKAIRKELYAIIRQRRSTPQATEDLEKQPYFLSQMLYEKDEDGKLLSEEEIADKVLMLFVSGSTSTSMVTFVVYFLADNPHVYEKVLNEQLEILKTKKPNEMLQWEDIRKMKYTRNFIDEVLRLAPGGQLGFKEALSDFTYAGYIIPKGWKVFWSSHTTHRNPEYFPNPDKFEPSRFEGNGPVPYTFVPFGGGPRTCPASEYVRVQIKIFIHCLVTKFKWEKVIPDEVIAGNFAPLPGNGLPIRLLPHGN